ncbi:hypothetical protein [Microbacterium lushaniae]|uniref:DUF7882 domain-containing protein n=1 Tax=Microbacterium lushaniae TaxID=2614639 RepID=A0A5J6L0V4_9MICO|nr:hypothetical protein [Microbacterium lushaniae]QEW02118.1 hypothetical protein F6J85_02735 [Microbacterium lushaniae]
MGRLFYGNATQPIEMPDRLLAHIKVVTATKLRRGESFTLSWRHPEDVPGGRSTIWLQPSIPLRFVFSTPEPELLDPAFLKDLANAANSSGGLSVDLNMPVPVNDEVSTPQARVPVGARAA